MGRRRFNVMAKSNAILGTERSAAATVALVVLCALGLVQLGTLIQSGWTRFRGGPEVPSAVPPAVVKAPAAALPAVPAVQAPARTAVAPSPVLSPAAGLPPLPEISAAASSGLPPLPSLASEGLPPLPALPGQASASPKVVSALPAPSSAVPPMPSRPAVANAPAPAASIPKTGNAQVDELIEVAAQSRELNDAPGALQALDRADLIMPDHPTVLREKALTLGKMGQADKAQELWDRIARLGPGAGASMVEARTSFSDAGSVPPAAPTGSLDSAFASLSSGAGQPPAGPLSLGACAVRRDPSVVRGQKIILTMPVRASPGAQIGVDDWNLDVFFYDRVDDVRVEPTKSDPVVYSFDMPVDFTSGEEVVTAVYHMPELTPQDVANIGHREYYGYVVKLYYKHRLMSTAASPRDLLNNPGGAGAMNVPAGNPLLPLPRPQ